MVYKFSMEGEVCYPVRWYELAVLGALFTPTPP